MISAKPIGEGAHHGTGTYLSELISEHRDGKTAAYTIDGSVLETVTEAYNVNRRTALEAEQDAEDWWMPFVLISRNLSMKKAWIQKGCWL